MSRVGRVHIGCSGWQYKHWRGQFYPEAMPPSRWFAHVRLHFGTKKYGGGYDRARLEEWADWLADHATRGRAIFAFLNNDSGGHAPRDAVTLRSLVHARLGSAGPHAGDRQLPRAV